MGKVTKILNLNEKIWFQEKKKTLFQLKIAFKNHNYTKKNTNVHTNNINRKAHITQAAQEHNLQNW